MDRDVVRNCARWMHLHAQIPQWRWESTDTVPRSIGEDTIRILVLQLYSNNVLIMEVTLNYRSCKRGLTYLTIVGINRELIGRYMFLDSLLHLPLIAMIERIFLKYDSRESVLISPPISLLLKKELIRYVNELHLM